jgi:hypothetical protein
MNAHWQSRMLQQQVQAAWLFPPGQATATVVVHAVCVVVCLQVVVRKNPDATTDEERSRLETVGRFHTGVFINKISQGSLVSDAGNTPW